MDPIARWLLGYTMTAAGEAGRRRAVEAQFGALPPGAYQAAVDESRRVRATMRAVASGPAATRMDTAMGLGRGQGDEVRVPVVYTTRLPSGHVSTTRADVLVRAHYRLSVVRAEVYERGAELAEQSDGQLLDVTFLPAPYYGPLQAGGHDPAEFLQP